MSATVIADSGLSKAWTVYATAGGIYRGRKRGYPVALERVADSLEELVQSCVAFDEDVTQRSYGGRR